jgi:soluble lytic murein transglycosylase
MPATAVSVAERIGAAPPTADDLFDPGTNLGLGAAELGRLLKLFGGRRAPAVAAYNAGEVQAGIWLDQCGTGCSDALYVANISFAATRAYTAAVLAAADGYVDLGMPAAAPLSD